MIPYLVVAAVSALVAFATTPLVVIGAKRFGWIDHPSDRKAHPKPTPTLGGAAIVLGVAVGIGVASLLPFFSQTFDASSEALAAVVGATLIFAVGAWDDIKHASVLGKLTWQILVAGVLVLLGVQVLYFYIPTQGILTLSPDLAVLLSVLWMVAMMNAVNFIDGLDGLAAGMMAIAAIAFFLFVFQSPAPFGGPPPAALICAAIAGACLGFLPWNFNPAKIFMGDAGAMPLGLLLAVATISGVGRNPYPPSGGDVAAFTIPILVPLLVLAIPFLDVALAILRRMRRGRSLGHADKEHIHHRLLDIGHSQRRAVLLMYLWSALISGCALAVAFINGRFWVLIVVLVALTIFLATFLPHLVGFAGSSVDATDREGSSGKHRGSPVPSAQEESR